MPAFDPVRDAVANSPRTPSYPLPSPSPLQTPTSASSNAFPFPPTPIESIHPPPRPPPPQKRPSSLSMLLNGPDEPPAKQHRLAPLMSPATEASLSLPAIPQPPTPSSALDRRPGSSSSTGSQPPRFRPSFPGSEGEGDHSSALSAASPSPTNSVSPSRPPPRSLPRHHGSDPSTISKTPEFTRPKLPYNPKRITPAGSVLRPLTETEVATWVSQNPLRYIDRPSQRLPDNVALGKRARNENDSIEGQPASKRSKDVRLIASHYNARPDVGVDKRQESPIIGLKSFNNWIKSVLITRFAYPALHPNTSSDRPSRNEGKVMDMGCGKGGDLQKWSKAKVSEYVGLDIATLSVDQAFHRWQDMQARSRGPGGRFDGEFAAVDCYISPIAEVLPPRRLLRPFDVVSMQFCMHYAFETEFKVRTMLDNVTRYLRVGGVFIGTIPNDQLLLEKLNELPADAEDLSFGNNVYTIRFDNRIKSIYGQRYSFYLKDAVDDVPEYIVHWDNFETLAASFGLKLIYKQEFHHMFEEHREHSEFGPLLTKMKVVDADGSSHMDEDQWEAANVYHAFAFEKVSNPAPT